ncbi:MAG TPA: DUF1801 domain-containing protein [Euzebyales bacterium]
MFDELLDDLDPDRRAAVSNVIAQVLAVVPDAEQGRSYGVPAFRWRGRPLLGVSVTKSHLSLLPFSSDVVEAVAGRLDGFRVTKGAVGFTTDNPVPADIIADMVRLRMAEIDA